MPAQTTNHATSMQQLVNSSAPDSCHYPSPQMSHRQRYYHRKQTHRGTPLHGRSFLKKKSHTHEQGSYIEALLCQTNLGLGQQCSQCPRKGCHKNLNLDPQLQNLSRDSASDCPQRGPDLGREGSAKEQCCLIAFAITRPPGGLDKSHRCRNFNVAYCS